jgi:ABC-type dipeptide/oligopeptide/nickel transport system ATPase component
MDRFLAISKQKSDTHFTSLGQAVCLVGRSGLGKTWSAHQALDKYVELTSEILRSKADTLEFLEKIRGTNIPVLLDEYETLQNLIGLRELRTIPTNGQFIVTSQIVPKFDFEIAVHEYPVKTFEQIKLLYPDATDENIVKSKGDLRWVERSLIFRSDDQDDFTLPRDFVTALVTKNSSLNPMKYLGHQVAEPGNCSAILNANYIDSPKVDFAFVSEKFSEGDIFEEAVFTGSWELMPYFNIFGCIEPAVIIGHTLKGPLKPGSSWTKFQNMCMRNKKIKNMSHRTLDKTLDVDSLMLLRDYGRTDLFREYGLVSADLDVMNHISPLRKVKAKDLANMKRALGA